MVVVDEGSRMSAGRDDGLIFQFKDRRAEVAGLRSLSSLQHHTTRLPVGSFISCAIFTRYRQRFGNLYDPAS
jgi:hypothetical protein